MSMYGSLASVSTVANSGDASGTTSCHQTSRPAVHGTVLTGAAQDEARPDARRLGHRLVGDRLHGHRLAAAEGAVGGDEQGRLAVAQPRAERLRSETGEHRQEDGAELAQREHRGHRFRQHRHEDPDAVPALDAELAQGVRQAVRLQLQLAEGERGAPRRRPPPRSARCARRRVLSACRSSALVT